jgi:hypothetical protein
MRRLKRSHDRIVRCGLGSAKKTIFVKTWIWQRKRRGADQVGISQPDAWSDMIARASAELASAGGF